MENCRHRIHTCMIENDRNGQPRVGTKNVPVRKDVSRARSDQVGTVLYVVSVKSGPPKTNGTVGFDGGVGYNRP